MSVSVTVMRRICTLHLDVFAIEQCVVAVPTNNPTMMLHIINVYFKADRQ